MGNREESDLLPKNQYQQNGSNEKSPFLTEPVRLTPAWEASNLPNDELNFKSMTMERVRMEMSPPIDKWRLVFLTFVLHGLGTLMPWNMFITAKNYFVDFKLGPEYTGEQDLAYAKYFLNYVGFAAQIPNLLFNWLNIFVKIGGNLTTRIVWSIFVEIIIFIITVVLAMSDSSSWPEAFFWITMICVVILNMANGIYQNTVYGMAATLPFKYTGAVVLGSNVSGLFTTIISIVSTEFASSDRTAAIYYFITAMFVLLVCFDTYFALPLNRFFKYHEMINEQEKEKEKSSSNEGGVPYMQVFMKAAPQLFNVFFVFFVTLTVFPAVHSDIKYNPADKTWFPVTSNEYFLSITCFLTFNLFAMLGSLTTSWINWPKPKYLIFPVVLRMLFIPLFMLCNYHPKNTDRALPVLISSNWAYWIIAILMSYSSGYLSSLGMMYAPQSVSPKYASTAGMFGAAMLITGIFSGIAFSLICPFVVKYIGW